MDNDPTSIQVSGTKSAIFLHQNLKLLISATNEKVKDLTDSFARTSISAHVEVSTLSLSIDVKAESTFR